MFKKIVPLILLLAHLTITLQNNEIELLTRTVHALNTSLDFVLSEYTNMNVDGMLGISETLAHLRMALRKTTNPTTTKNLKMLIGKSELIYNLQTPNLPYFPFKYYVFNNYLLPPQLWEREIPYSYGELNPNPKVYTGPYDVDNLLEYRKYVRRSTFEEEQSDQCLVEVAVASDDTEPHDCPMSDVCYDYMVKMPTSYTSRFPGYGVTHMALYLQIARLRNCNFDYHKVNEILKEQCSYILWELEKNVEHGYVEDLDDLFFEQIDICGMEGFGEFLKEDYLEHMLQVQDSHGGFGVSSTRAPNRPKRESVNMKYGSNSHTTGLGISALGLYLRVLIEKPFFGKAFYEAQ